MLSMYSFTFASCASWFIGELILDVKLVLPVIYARVAQQLPDAVELKPLPRSHAFDVHALNPFDAPWYKAFLAEHEIIRIAE